MVLSRTDMYRELYKYFQSFFFSSGTAGYIAPEIYDRSEHGREVDVYSFGIMINEIFDQEEPFHEEQQALRYRVLNDNDSYTASDWFEEVPRLIQEMVMQGICVSLFFSLFSLFSLSLFSLFPPLMMRRIFWKFEKIFFLVTSENRNESVVSV